MTPTHTSDWSKRDNFCGGYTQYRIELTQTDHGWYQRHIWRKDDGTTNVEEWIPSFDYSKRPGWLAGFKAAA
jgi:hypothetical protein